MTNQTQVSFIVGKAHYKVDDIVVEPHYQGLFYIVDCDIYAKLFTEEYKDYTYDYENPIRVDKEIYFKVTSEPMYVTLDWELLSDIEVRSSRNYKTN